MGGLKHVGVRGRDRGITHDLTLGEVLISFGELKHTFPAGPLHPNLPFSYRMLLSAA